MTGVVLMHLVLSVSLSVHSFLSFRVPMSAPVLCLRLCYQFVDPVFVCRSNDRHEKSQNHVFYLLRAVVTSLLAAALDDAAEHLLILRRESHSSPLGRVGLEPTHPRG